MLEYDPQFYELNCYTVTNDLKIISIAALSITFCLAEQIYIQYAVLNNYMYHELKSISLLKTGRCCFTIIIKPCFLQYL